MGIETKIYSGLPILELGCNSLDLHNLPFRYQPVKSSYFNLLSLLRQYQTLAILLSYQFPQVGGKYSFFPTFRLYLTLIFSFFIIRTAVAF